MSPHAAVFVLDYGDPRARFQGNPEPRGCRHAPGPDVVGSRTARAELGYARGVDYRDDAGDAGEAPSAEGPVRAEFAPRHVKLAVALRSIEISDAFVVVVEHHRKDPRMDRRISLAVTGRVIVARDVARDGLGLWVEVEPGGRRAGFRRVFWVEPVGLLEPAGLAALAAFDRLAQRVRQALAHLAPDVVRALEIGSPAAGGLDKLLVLDHGERWVVYARRLFRDRARFALAVHDDGRIVVPAARGATREVTVRSRHGVTVVGDYLRFADPHGADLARVSLPWLAPEDRGELARRIGKLIDRDAPAAAAWPPRLIDREPSG
jgi:hypothetical protein